MKKKSRILLGLCGLLLCMFFGFIMDSQAVKADLILDEKQIDGSYDIFFNQQPLLEIQFNGVVVWRAGADITYAIDNDISETHFIPYGQDTLSVITCSKEGYEFVGWREDGAAAGEILETDLCIGKDKTLYAVFRRAVAVSYYNGSEDEQTVVDFIYYNNGNISIPEFTIEQQSLDGWTARGWSTDSAADAEVEFDVLDSTVIDSDITLYGLYNKTITVDFDGNGAADGAVESLTGTAHYNSSGNTLNPVFKLPSNGFTNSGFIFAGWIQGDMGTVHEAESSVTLSADTVFKAKWQAPARNFGYTGGIQQYPVPADGYYKLEVWGASGGNGKVTIGHTNGGAGGYSCGYVYLNEGTTLYVVVGGSNKPAEDTDWDDDDGDRYRVDVINPGGYNGGGAGKTYESDGWVAVCGAGGGATHIATKAGLLRNLESYKSDVLIVAGGGGGASAACWATGASSMYYGGGGGGTSGGLAYPVHSGTSAYTKPEASQSSGYAFGVGESSAFGGGGGWYGGYHGSGGSGYVGGCISSLNHEGTNYSSYTSTSSNIGHGRAVITYMGQ